jgi:uncharacterized protein
MKLFLSEIKDYDQELNFTEQDTWISKTILSIDEELQEAKRLNKTLATRPAQVHMNVRKVDHFYMLTGAYQTEVNLLCSRCATPFAFDLKDRFSTMFSKDKELAGVAFLDQDQKPKGQNKGFARHAHDDESEYEHQNESAHDLEMTYLAEDYIDLADVLLEQFQLKIPFQPYCKEDCKGICTTCGTDLNKGRCACSKIKSNAFSVLKDFKVDKKESSQTPSSPLSKRLALKPGSHKK